MRPHHQLHALPQERLVVCRDAAERALGGIARAQLLQDSGDQARVHFHLHLASSLSLTRRASCEKCCSACATASQHTTLQTVCLVKAGLSLLTEEGRGVLK